MSEFSVCVIIPAAGASTRYREETAAGGGGAGGLGVGRSKLDEDLGGRPVLQRTVELFNKIDAVSSIIVAGPADDEAYAEFSTRHADKLSLLGARLCRGGAHHRYETVANALKLVPESCTHIAVHDAARPCTSLELIERVFGAARDGGFAGVIPAVDVPDTLKRVGAEWIANPNPDPLAAILGESASNKKLGRWVEETLSRERVVGVQTPQVFKAEVLRRAYAQADLTSTDDAQLVERLLSGENGRTENGRAVLVVPGESTNIKLTRAADLSLARAILGVRPPEERAAHKRF